MKAKQPRRFRAGRGVGLALAGALCVPAFAPPVDAAQGGRGQRSPAQRQVNPMQTAPGRLAERAEDVRTKALVFPVIVVVPDVNAYLDAVSRWSPAGRFPVLIDDGTDSARENIARFARDFKPEKVVRWSGDPSRGESGLRERIERAAARAWGADSTEALRAEWAKRKFVPFGAVITNEEDPAWTGALALAAGRGQPILWVERPRGRIGAVMKPENYAEFDAAVIAGLSATGYRWKGIADDIDALTVCLNMPLRLSGTEKQRAAASAVGENNTEGQPRDPGEFALTDTLGRHADDALYAWSGAIVGTPAEAAYRAICALFLQPDRAWLFNGFDLTPPADAFQVSPASQSLRRKGLSIVDFTDPPRGGLADWRSKIRRGLTANLIIVNCSGNKGWFNLSPGRGHACDLPALNLPPIVYFTHSHSAQDLDDRATLGRRWLDSGAYAYVGAVDEPFLQTFTPPFYLAQGLGQPIPLGVMARPNIGRAWKINLIGDPLICLGKPAPRVAGAAPDLPGAESLEQVMKDALTRDEFAAGAACLVKLGRDEGASALGRGVIDDRLGDLTPDLARVLFPVYFRLGRADRIARVYDSMPDDAKHEQINIDRAWQALGPELESTLDPLVIDVLSPHVRSNMLVEDASQLANAIQRLHGSNAAAQFVQRQMEKTTDQQHLTFLRTLRERVGS